jgi:hypothetical protein
VPIVKIRISRFVSLSIASPMLRGLDRSTEGDASTAGCWLGARRRPCRAGPVAVSSPILSIVWPCFGQDCIECLAVRRPKGESDRLLRVTLDGKRNVK